MGEGSGIEDNCQGEGYAQIPLIYDLGELGAKGKMGKKQRYYCNWYK